MTVPVMDSSGLSWYNWTKADKDHVMCVFNYSTAFFNCNIATSTRIGYGRRLEKSLWVDS